MFPDGRVGDAGEVVEIGPLRRSVLSWRNEFMPELKAEGSSRLTYEIHEREESVKLTVIHEMDLADPKLIAGVSQGWPQLLSSLKSQLETGESLFESRTCPEGM